MTDPTRLRADLCAGLACALVGLVIAIEPHLTMLWRYGTLEYLSDHDEMLYLNIARPILQGEGRLRDPYLPPSRNVPSLYSWLQFAPLALLTRGLGLPLLALSLMWRVVGGLALGASLYILFRKLLKSTAHPVAWSLGAALTCLADSGFCSGRMLLENVSLLRHFSAGTTPLTKPDALAQYRVVTPLLNLPVLLLLLAVVSIPPFRGRRGVVLGSICLGLCYYLYFFFWTAAVLGIGLFVASSLALTRLGPADRSHEWLRAAKLGSLVLLGGLLLGAPNLAQTLSSGFDPGLKPILERMSKGYHLPTGHPARIKYLLNTWVLAKLGFGALGLLALRVRGTELLWWTAFAAYALANSAFVTSLEFENFHWSYIHTSVGEILVLATLCQVLERAAFRGPARLGALWIVPIGLVAFALVWRPYEALTAPEAIRNNRALAELRPLQPVLSKLGPEAVLVGPSRDVHIAQLLSRANLLYHDIHSQIISLIPDREIHERDALNAWLLGLELHEYERLSTLDHFGYVEPDDPRWPLDAIKAERISAFRSLDSGDSTLLERYFPTHLIRRTSEGTPPRGGPWRRVAGDESWILWARTPMRHSPPSAAGINFSG